MRTKYQLFSKTLLSIIVAASLCLVFVPRAFAQEATPRPDQGCIACHEPLYYNYDTGKSFCLCEQKMTCLCCHGGNPEARTAAEAHAGMLAFPSQAEGARCQTCHPQDYSERLKVFASVAGVSTFHPLPPTLTPQPAASSLGTGPLSGFGLPVWMCETWRVLGLGAVMAALILVAVFGYYCWKQDCLLKRQS